MHDNSEVWMFSTPAHLQTDPAKKPSQVVLTQDEAEAVDDMIPMTEDEKQPVGPFSFLPL